MGILKMNEQMYHTWAITWEAEGGAIRAPHGMREAVLRPVQEKAHHGIWQLDVCALHKLIWLIIQRIPIPGNALNHFKDVPSMGMSDPAICRHVNDCQPIILNGCPLRVR